MKDTDIKVNVFNSNHYDSDNYETLVTDLDAIISPITSKHDFVYLSTMRYAKGVVTHPNHALTVEYLLEVLETSDIEMYYYFNTLTIKIESVTLGIKETSVIKTIDYIDVSDIDLMYIKKSVMRIKHDTDLSTRDKNLLSKYNKPINQ